MSAEPSTMSATTVAKPIRLPSDCRAFKSFSSLQANDPTRATICTRHESDRLWHACHCPAEAPSRHRHICLMIPRFESLTDVGGDFGFEQLDCLCVAHVELDDEIANAGVDHCLVI